MKVLFCTDGSRISYHSIQNFSHWFKDFSIDILCAADWTFMPDNVAIDGSDFVNYCKNSADSILEYSDKFLTELGLTVDNKIKMCGSTVDCILETLNTNEYEYVVLGSHGKKGMQKWLGSVSQEIASSANISTYISKELNARKKILFAIDTSDKCPKIIHNCLEKLNLEDKEIHIATVYETPDYLFLEGNINSDWILDIEKKQEHAAGLLLNEYENIFNSNNYNISHKVVLHGNPANELIKYLEKEKIDIVVCGIKNRKNLPKFLLNSVSKRVLEMTKSDVLIVRINNP